MKSGMRIQSMFVIVLLFSAVAAFGQSNGDDAFGNREWGESYQECGRWGGQNGQSGYGGGMMGGGYGRNGRGNSRGGMMGGGYGRSGRGGMMGGYGGGMMGNRSYGGFAGGNRIEIADATESVESFLEYEGLKDLEIAEVMEFEQNFYAIVSETSTDIGAMELLIDPYSGYVTYEPGPNMMWNTKYGHMGRRWWRPNRSMSLTEAEAVAAANEALEADGYSLVADSHADEFYGYYTLHVLDGSKIVGMLSVNGFDGAVWYHDWHGDYLGMTEGH